MKRMMLVVATAALGFAATAQAQQQQQQQEHPCMGDAARLCPDVEPGGGAQLQCLKAHKTALSPACKKNVMKMKVKSMERQQLQQQQQTEPPPVTP